MKALILAAGEGRRMLPLTENTPKPMLMVGKYRLIEYHIHKLKKAGVTSIIINTAYLADVLQSFLGDGSRYGVQIEYSYEGSKPLETLGGIVFALSKLGDEPFLLINGDVFSDYDFCNLLSKKPNMGHMVLVDNPSYRQNGDFNFENNVFIDSSELPFTYSGIAVYHPNMFKSCAFEKGNKLPLGPYLKMLAKNNELTAELYQGEWFDVGTPQRLLSLQQRLKDLN